MATGEPARRSIASGRNARVETAVNERESIEGFLRGYRPKNDHFTSNAEIDLITRRLRLNERTEEELSSLRDRVTAFYDGLAYNRDGDGNITGRTENYWDYIQGMYSVTAVIDYVRRNRR